MQNNKSIITYILIIVLHTTTIKAYTGNGY